MIVLDASAALELVLRSEKGLRVAERVAVDGGPYLAPHLIDPEALQGLRDLVRGGRIQLAQADAALAVFAQFPFSRHAHGVLRPRIWELRHNLTAYDATYVAIAELWDCPLVTCDGPLSRAPGHDATIELF